MAGFSQNEKQIAEGTYSYSKYDDLGRVIEVGVHDGSFNDAILQVNLNNPDYPGMNNSEQVETYYSESYSPDFEQNFLQNRVSYSISHNGQVGYPVTSIYSYDAHGNVERVGQSFPDIGLKVTEYEYDLVSGNVLEVAYQKDQVDEFYHKYSYDADNRIETVETSKDGVLWECDAKYDYYKHGPLKRVELAHDKIQGLDYIYTLNGWLKSINTPNLEEINDPGSDGVNNPTFAEDAFGMQLNYFYGDYTRITGLGTNLNKDVGFSQSLHKNTGLYNGNINAWLVSAQDPGLDMDEEPYILHGDKMTVYQYRYDELNRLVRAKYKFFDETADPNTPWNGDFGRFATLHMYDANGNITDLWRWSHYGPIFDKLSYEYDMSGYLNEDFITGGLKSNKLNHYTDSDTANYTAADDLVNPSNSANYDYDEIGNLTSDIEEGIGEINWLANGKIESIDFTDFTKPNLYFNYDPQGNRVSKREVLKDPNDGSEFGEDHWTTTYYVRDASGNLMATYNRVHTPLVPLTSYTAVTSLEELPMFGSSRLGLLEMNNIITEEEISNITGLVGGGTSVGFYNSVISGAYNSTNNTTKQIQMLNNPDEFVLDNSLEEITGTPSRVIYSKADENGESLMTITGVNGSSSKVLVYNKWGDIIPGSEVITIGKNSQIGVLEIEENKLFFLFTTDKNGKLYYHKVDLSLNYGQGGVPEVNNNPEINIPLYATNNFESSILAVQEYRTGVPAIVLKRKDATYSYLHVIEYDQNKKNFSKSDKGSRFASRNGVDNLEIIVSPNGSYYLATNNLPNGSDPLGDGEIRMYDKTQSSGNLSLNRLIAAKNDGKITSAAFSISSKILYYIEETSSKVFINSYNVSNLNHSEVYSKNVDNRVSTIELWPDGKIYTTNMYTGDDILIIEDPDDNPANLVLTQKSVNLGPDLTLSSYLPAKFGSFSGNSFVEADMYERTMDKKRYEINDHLGNVRAVISDVKLPQNYTSNVPEDFITDLKAVNNYYPGGSLQPGRSFSSNSYRYGIQGWEKDDEITGIVGSHYTTTYREHDTRLMRTWSMDPKNQYASPYVMLGNNPINGVDPDGAWFWEAKHIRQARKFRRATGGEFHKWKDENGDRHAAVSSKYGYFNNGGSGSTIVSVNLKTGDQKRFADQQNINAFVFHPGDNKQGLLIKAGLSKQEAFTTAYSGKRYLERYAMWAEDIAYGRMQYDRGGQAPGVLKAVVGIIPPLAIYDAGSMYLNDEDLFGEKPTTTDKVMGTIGLIPLLKVSNIAVKGGAVLKGSNAEMVIKGVEKTIGTSGIIYDLEVIPLDDSTNKKNN